MQKRSRDKYHFSGSKPVTGNTVKTYGEGRVCECGVKLSQYNSAKVCGPCNKKKDE